MKQQIKLTIAICLGIAIMLGGCSKDKYDDTDLKKQIAEQQKKIDDLETLMAALRNNAQITSVTQNDDGTATFIFADGNKIIIPFELGAGTEADPRKIFNAADLNAMRNNLAMHYILMANINVSNWLPVGDYTTNSAASMFTGSLNGNGHTITIYSFDNVPNGGNGSGYRYGLFGVINGGKVSKLHVVISYYVGTVSQTNERIYYGGIAGWLYSGALIENCSVSGALSAVGASDNIQVGGIAGYISQSKIQNCYATGSISATGGSRNNAGGIVSLVENSSTITACVALQSSINNGGNADRSGRVVGYINGGTVAKSHANSGMQVNGGNATTDIGAGAKNGANCTNANWSLASWWTSITTNGLGWDNTIWDFTGVGATVYPVLRVN